MRYNIRDLLRLFPRSPCIHLESSESLSPLENWAGWFELVGLSYKHDRTSSIIRP
ncbi:hypothetical protein QUB05_31800 [Microcoleus sp. F10-C6]|uniref:hypothetical protein n=1 Tax=Microcoleus sp. F10B5 TaxID=3055341 RepID=UPI002FCEAFFE